MSINTNISIYPAYYNPAPGSVGQSPIINSANGAGPAAPTPPSAVNQTPPTAQTTPPTNNTNNSKVVNKTV